MSLFIAYLCSIFLQIKDLQKEIRDIQAYTVVYKDHSLVSTDKRRNKPSYTNIMNTEQLSQTPTKMLAPVRKSRLKSWSAKERQSDPFHVKNCLQDVENDRDIFRELKQPLSLPLAPIDMTKTTVKPRVKVKRTHTAMNARTASKEYQSLLPGNCTSYYSIRKFYEEEKDKLIHKWSPEERRKQTVKWILKNLKFPEYDQIRRKTTSALFREFNKPKMTGKITISDDLISNPGDQSESAEIEEITSLLNDKTTLNVETYNSLPKL